MDEETLTYITANWFLILIIFLLFVHKAGKSVWLQTTFLHSVNYKLNCVIHFGYINAGKSQIIGIFHKMYGVLSHFVGNILKTQDIWGKMSNILVKWLHYMELFPNIWDILVRLHFCVAFFKESGSPS